MNTSQMRIQNPAKQLRWSILQKTIDSFLAVNYFGKTLHLRCLTGFSILSSNYFPIPTLIYFKVTKYNWNCSTYRYTLHVDINFPNITRILEMRYTYRNTSKTKTIFKLKSVVSFFPNQQILLMLISLYTIFNVHDDLQSACTWKETTIDQNRKKLKFY